MDTSSEFFESSKAFSVKMLLGCNQLEGLENTIPSRLVASLFYNIRAFSSKNSDGAGQCVFLLSLEQKEHQKSCSGSESNPSRDFSARTQPQETPKKW